MNFLNPYFLLGLLAVAIPVVIHLINLRRPKQIAFSTLSFFKELQKSTIRRIRIKQYVLMALRVGAVLFLALALARPFLPPTMTGSSGSDEPKAIAIIIDNSASMNRIGTSGPLIEQAREVGNTVIDGARDRDRFLVASTNGAGRTLSLTGASRASELIAETEVSNTGNYLAETMRQVYGRLQQAPMRQAVVYLITDGQQSQIDNLEDFELERDASSKPVTLQMVELEDAGQQNLAVTSLELDSRMLSRGTPLTLRVEVRNMGSAAAANQFVSLEVEGRMAGQYQLTLEPGESREFLFGITPDAVGDLSGRIVLEGDEIPFDNSRWFVIRIPESRSVLLVSEQKSGSTEFVSYLSPALEAAQLANTQINFKQQQAAEVDQSSWLSNDVIVLDGLREIPEYWFDDLQGYVQDGRGLLFFPSEQGDVRNYNDFFGLFNAGEFTNIRGEYAGFRSVDRMGELVEGHPVLDEIFEKEEDEQISVDLPELFFYYQYRPSGNTGSYTILESGSGAPLLAEQRFGEGKVLISALGADPGWSNFPITPLFAPVYYRSILYAASTERGGIEQHILGEPFAWEGGITQREVELVKGEETVKPEVQSLPEGIRLRYPGREWEPGILTISAGGQQRRVAINQHIMESDFSTLEDKQLDNMLGNFLTINSVIDAGSLSGQDLREELNAAGFGEEIWNWFIWFAILCLLAETLVSKLYRAETIS